MKKRLVFLVFALNLMLLTACGETQTPIPEFSLVGSSEVVLEVHEDYNELGIDYQGEDFEIVIDGQVRTSTIGEYKVTYYLRSSSGEESSKKTRTVTVIDSTSPVLELLGEDELTVEAGSDYIEPGALVSDNYDQDLEFEVIGDVDTSVLGEQILTYFTIDQSGNESEQINRVVTVVDTTAPELILQGEELMFVEAGEVFLDPGVNIIDNYDMDIDFLVDGNVDTNALGEYTLTYSAVDSEGNQAESITRTIIVQDTTAPVITLNGESVIVLPLEFDYDDLGANVYDSFSSVEDLILEVDSSLDVRVPGTYEIVYVVADQAGNESTITRHITVKDFSVDFEWNLREDDTYEVVAYIGNDEIVYIPDMYNNKSVSIIQEYAFTDSEVEYVWIPNSIVSIESYAFYNARTLSEVVFEEASSLEVIKRWGFYRTNLETIELPNALKTLYEGVFSHTHLASVSLPASLETIYGNPFSAMNELSTLSISPENMEFTVVDNVLFTKDLSRLIAYGRARTYTSYTVPTGVEIIGENAFDQILSLEELILPEGLVEIENRGVFWLGLTSIEIPSTLETIGHNVFVLMEGLEAFEVHEDNENFMSFEGVLFSKDLSVLYAYPSNRNGLNYHIPCGVIEVESGAFWGAEITELYLSRTVEVLRGGAFMGISSFESVYVPNSISTMENGVFIGEGNLTIYMEFPEQPEFFDPEWNQEDSQVVWGYDVSSHIDYEYQLIIDAITGSPAYEITTYLGSEINLVIPCEYQGLPITSIGEEAFVNTNIESVVFPDTINHIGIRAFRNLASLTSIEFGPNSTLISIGEAAFSFTSIEEVLLPETLEYIGRSAFMSNSLQAIHIPGNVETIEGNPFAYNHELDTITVDENNVNYMAEDNVLFDKNQSRLIFYAPKKPNTSYSVPSSVVILEHHAFDNARNLSELILNEGLTTISQGTFGNMILDELMLPSTLSNIESNGGLSTSVLESILVEESNAFFKSIDGVLYSADGKILIAYPGGKRDVVYHVALGTETINASAFMTNGVITEIVFPDSLIKIERRAFAWNRSLESIYIPSSVLYIEDSAFSNLVNAKIYVEAMSKPDGWSDNWKSSDIEVEYGYTID